ncbi:MAG: glycosyltransferase [Thermoleophilaceae bacterium]|nr:glycosyltransferase [Thermoleophilaceae bacterium]
MPLTELQIHARPVADAFEALRPEQADQLLARIDETRSALDGRCVWNVNSTARGGGVAEMLDPLVAYARGAGIDSRWAVISGDSEFYEITKRIHNRLHGSAGDHGPLGEAERSAYEATLTFSGNALRKLVAPGDIVVLHDPQTAGLAPDLVSSGAHVVWRCHIGIDDSNDFVEEAWSFLRPYIDCAHLLVFSRRQHVWDGIDHDRVRIVPPAIDHRSAKNQPLGPEPVNAILRAAGLHASPGSGRAAFVGRDGNIAEVERRAEMLGAPELIAGLPIVTQVSRWDHLKDPVGVMRGFIEHVQPHQPSQLVLAGPSATAVADDPEQSQVLDEVLEEWHALDKQARATVVVACLPMDDIEENAAIVNALQRHSDVVVQKSLAEGFGLTVTEAMWKGTPVVASGVGGIRDQIEHLVTGLLLEEPSDIETFGEHVSLLLREPVIADGIGASGRNSVLEKFLISRHLLQDVELYDELLVGDIAGAQVRAGI